MNITKSLRLILAATVIITFPGAKLHAITAPKDAPADTTEPARPPTEANPWLAPITVPAGAYTSHDLQKQEDAWYDRSMRQPFLKRIPDDKPWKKDAGKFIDEAIKSLQTQHHYKESAEDGKKLITAGCDDALVAALTPYFRCYTPDSWNVADAAATAFKRIDGEKYYSAAVIRIAGLLANDVTETKTTARSPEIDKRVTELTKVTLAAGDYPGDDDYLFMHHVTAWSWGWRYFTNNYEAAAQAIADGKAPEWVQHMLKGQIEVKRAWDQRGPGYSDTVTHAGWIGFDKLYDMACEDYTASWKLNPKRPDAASEMVGITMAGHGQKGDTIRLWFDRAVAAQFDYIPAYDAVAWGLRPRWGGSVQHMIEFARLCADTRRFDTEVPVQLFRILGECAEEAYWPKVFHNPVVQGVIAPTAFGIADDPSRRDQWKEQYSLAAVRAYFGRDGAASDEALNRCGGELLPEAADVLYSHLGDFGKMKKENAVIQTPAGRDFIAAQDFYYDGNLDEAAAAFNKCQSDLEKSDASLASVPADWAKAVEVEKKLSNGDWVKIPLESGFWRFQGGDWKSTADGAFEITGTTDAMAVALPVTGNKYEVRCEMEVDSPGKDAATAGVVLGEHGTGYYVVCGFKRSRGVDDVRPFATSRWTGDGGYPSVALQQSNTILLQLADGRATYHFNGVSVMDHYRSVDSPVDKDYSRTGLGARDLKPGTTIRIRNVEVKKDIK